MNKPTKVRARPAAITLTDAANARIAESNTSSLPQPVTMLAFSTPQYPASDCFSESAYGSG